MDDRQIRLEQDIRDMQCWVLRQAQKKWGLETATVVTLFREHDVLGFIRDCYDMLHLSSYSCALADVEEYLRNRGVPL